MCCDLLLQATALTVWPSSLLWLLLGSFCSCSCFSHYVFRNSANPLSSPSELDLLLFSADKIKGERERKKKKKEEKTQINKSSVKWKNRNWSVYPQRSVRNKNCIPVWTSVGVSVWTPRPHGLSSSCSSG